MTDAKATSPVPPEGATGPSPLTVGKRFVKQYYQVLSSTPDQIFRFYNPSLSVLSHGEGSNATTPLAFEQYEITTRWGDAKKMRIELEHGAIDAQVSVNGGILLVVTGHVVLDEVHNAFVHTFFLTTVGNTKRFYVHNDILRFLNEDQAAKKTGAGAVADEKVAVKEEEPVVVEPVAVAPTPEPEVQPEDVDAGGGVEESKEVMDDEEDEPPAVEEEKVSLEEEQVPAIAEEPVVVEKEVPAPVAASEPEPKEKKGKKAKGRGRSPPQQEQKPQQPAAKPVPGSWASLVASSGPAPAPAPAASSPTKAPKAPAPAKKTEAAPAAEKSASTSSSSAPQDKDASNNTHSSGTKDKKQFGDRPKRDPDCTLVIKNLADGTKDTDLRTLFEPFAIQTKTKVVGATVSNHRGLAFVDYDSVAPVLAAVAQHQKEPLQLNGRVLEVDQKTAEQRARRNQRGGYRSGSPNNSGSGGFRGGGERGDRGGRDNRYRRGGDRGGGGGRGDREGGGRGDRSGGGRGGRGERK
jgi:hypothetical protein